MRIVFFFLLSSFSTLVYGQFAILPYNIARDSLTHISVFHSGNTEKVRLSSQPCSDTLSVIYPDIRIKSEIVDHKCLTGEMLVREYYNYSIMIGYIEFAEPDMKRSYIFIQIAMFF
jgi:hypothetical protein